MKELLSAEALQEIKKFNRNIEWLKKRDAVAAPKSWVRPSVIMKKHGWSRAQLDTARRNGYIEWKKDGNHILYNPLSVNQDHVDAILSGKLRN